MSLQRTYFGLQLLIAWFLFTPASSYSFSKLDSLRKVVAMAHEPVAKYHAQLDIGIYFAYEEINYDSSLVELKIALSMVPTSNDTLMVQALENVAKGHRRANDDKGAIPYYRAAKNMCLKLEDYAKAGYMTMRVGRLYYSNTEYDSAMTYYQKAQKIFEENDIYNEDHGQLMHYIGSVFKRQEDIKTAMEWYQKQIDYGREHGFRGVEADGLSLYASLMDDPREALKIKFEVLQIYIEEDHKSGIAMLHNNIGSEYAGMEMYDSAYFYVSKSLEYKRSIPNDQSGLCSGLSHTAQILSLMGRNMEAKVMLEEAEEIGLGLSHKRQIRLESVYNGLRMVHEALGNYKEGMRYQSLYYVYRDSVRDAAHQDAIAEMALAYETEKKEKEILALEQDKKTALHDKQLSDERAEQEELIGRFYLYGGIFFLLISAFAIYKFIESQKQKKIIEEQKLQVETKNRDIMDSMNYASSIQRAIITSDGYISSMFKEYFVIFKPRDIVSGDFYWAFETEDGKKMIAVGDCTGHGVPGAMMSMLGCSFLNEIVVEKGIHEPAEVLDSLRDNVKKALNKGDQNDGMDMAFCVIKDDELKFAGANLPIYILRDNTIEIIKGDKQPIGEYSSGEVPFETKAFSVKKHDTLYLFSDGYADQFGGEKGKKYKYQTLRNKLLEIYTKNLSLQGNILDQDFEQWKGDFEQVDDVCLFGIRI